MRAYLRTVKKHRARAGHKINAGQQSGHIIWGSPPGGKKKCGHGGHTILGAYTGTSQGHTHPGRNILRWGPLYTCGTKLDRQLESFSGQQTCSAGGQYTPARRENGIPRRAK